MGYYDWVFVAPAPVWDELKDTKPIGGTHFALIELTRALARMGYTVAVYANCGDNGGNVRENLTYIPIKEFDYDGIACEWFVSQRQFGLAWDKINASKKFVWSQDNEIPDPQRDFERGLDGIVTASGFHRDMLVKQHNLDGSRVHVCYQPIDVRDYGGTHPLVPSQEGSEENNLNSPSPLYKGGIYTSNPDRGLRNLLRIYPEIKKRIPEFVLRVYSGWMGYRSPSGERFTASESDKRMKDMIPMLTGTEGIEWNRGAGQVELIGAYKQTGLFLYPTEFIEAGCCSFIQACASGCVPVVTNTGVFPEYKALCNEVVISDIEGFSDSVEFACEQYDTLSRSVREWALETFDVDRIAFQWARI